MNRPTLLLFACLPLAACGVLSTSRPVEHRHAAGTTAGGTLWRDLQTGRGEGVRRGDRVTVDYVIELEDGTPVDSTRERGRPETFVLGEAPIAGWNEALVGMRPGGRRFLDVPPERAFGKAGLPGRVPPNARLACRIELRAVEPD
jgi:FKBP-type peptidyl-prolyl cis-trans isomerase